MKLAAFIVSAAALTCLAVSIANSAPIARTALGVRQPPLTQRLRAADAEACDTTIKFRLNSLGGQFRIPACAGWKGLMGYGCDLGTGGGCGQDHQPTNVETSVTNSFGAPPPPSGTPIFYMSMFGLGTHGCCADVFMDQGVTSTFKSPAFNEAHTYTLYVYDLGEILGEFGTCFSEGSPNNDCTITENLGSPKRGSHTITFVSPLNGVEFSGIGYPALFQFTQN